MLISNYQLNFRGSQAKKKHGLDILILKEAKKHLKTELLLLGQPGQLNLKRPKEGSCDNDSDTARKRLFLSPILNVNRVDQPISQLPFTDEETKFCQVLEASLDDGINAFPSPEELVEPSLAMIQNNSGHNESLSPMVFGAGCQIQIKKMEHFARSLDDFKK